MYDILRKYFLSLLCYLLLQYITNSLIILVLDHFKQNWFFALEHLRQTILCPFGPKKSFLTEMVEMGPKGSQMVKNTWVDHFSPSWTLLDHFGTLTSLPFLVQNGPFLGQTQSWKLDPKVKTLPKAQRTWGLSSYHKITILNIIQLQNLH